MRRYIVLVKSILALLLAIIILLVLIKSSNAALLGVNRASLTYADVLRNGYAEQQVVVTLGSPNDVRINYEARGDIAEWIRFEPESSVIVNQDNPGIINVIVEPSADARVDSYEGIILITTGALGEVQSQMGTNVVVAFEVKVNLSVTDTQIISCTAGGIDLSSVEINELNLFRADVSNTGNVRIRPSFDMKIYSQMQEQLVKEYSFTHSSEIIPTKTETIQNRIDLDLEPGQYWAEILEPVCGAKSLVTFSILERGGISDEGELLRVRTTTWAETNDIVPIRANFVNRGSRVVGAQFKGVISKDDKIMKIIESEVIDVSPNQEIDLEMFYTPDEPGQYRVSGRVHYNNKVTYERGTIINVNQEDLSVDESNSLTIFFSIVVLVLAVLVFLILRKKKSKKRRF